MTEPFIGLGDLGTLLGQDLAQDDLAVIALDSACEAVRSYIDDPINLVEETVRIDGTGSYRLVLPRPRVRLVDSVTETSWLSDETTLLVEDTDYIVERSGILRRLTMVWPEGQGNIEVTYTHGWDVSETPAYERVPSDIRRVALELAKRLYQSASTAAGGITSETIGGYRYTVDASAGGAVELTLQEMDFLKHYRDTKAAPTYQSVVEAS